MTDKTYSVDWSPTGRDHMAAGRYIIQASGPLAAELEAERRYRATHRGRFFVVDVRETRAA